MEVKAIFFDCDGTLLSHKTNTVPQSARTALEMLRQKGIRCILSTGRHVSELASLQPMKDLSFDAWITLNGAVSYDADGIFDSYPISKDDIRTVYEYLQDNPLPVQFLEEKESYINLVNDTVIRSQAMIHTPVPPIGNIDRILTHPIYMMIPFGIKEAEPLLSLLHDVSATCWNAHDAIDVFHKDAGKEKGMEAVLKRYGIRREETAAFGDGMNDCAMLEYAGIGAAMGNSDPNLKKRADLVADDIDEDGIFKALKQLEIL